MFLYISVLPDFSSPTYRTALRILVKYSLPYCIADSFNCLYNAVPILYGFLNVPEFCY